MRERVSVTRRSRFVAGHYFWLADESEADNRKRFGPSANRPGHGHNYELLVTVTGGVDPATGMVINLKDLKALVDQEIVARFDFRHFNEDVPFFKHRQPCLENLVLLIWALLLPKIEAFGLELTHVRIFESDDLYVDYAGENWDALKPADGELARMIYFTRRYDFPASHRLYNPDFTDEQNCEIFRECNNPNGHGHNYELFVTVKGMPDPKTGMIVDLWGLDETVKRVILSRVDHKNLNVDVDFLKGHIPTAENIVRLIWHELAPHIPAPAALDKLLLIETRNNMAEYRGDAR